MKKASPKIVRSCKVSIGFATAKKRNRIKALLQSYRAAVNTYIKKLWSNPTYDLDARTLAILTNTRLSERYKSCALKQAIDIVRTTRLAEEATGNGASCPVLKGMAKLDHKVVDVIPNKESTGFDIIIKISSLVKGKRIIIPTKKTSVINKWLNRGWRLGQSIGLSETEIIVYVEYPEVPKRKEGTVVGFDIGVNKLIADSDGNFFGTEFKEYRDKVRRRKPGSKGKLRARRARDQFINRVIKQLPWDSYKAIGFENLNNIKYGKRKDRSKNFRKAMAPWTYRRVLNRVSAITQENGVRLELVDPANTSRTCPSCGKVSKTSRRGERFVCVSCNHSGDSDTFGAQIVLVRTLRQLGSVESPGLLKESV